MSPVVGRVERNHDVVAHANRDLLQATRAQVLLAGLEWVNEGDFEVVLVVAFYPSRAHKTRMITTTTAAATIT
ncbi:MAG: hypothetical protein Q8K63_07185 [Acidimicrobiales bacterium]|nr:hypothetical protein [Acidimicrobiales bacterium]